MSSQPGPDEERRRHPGPEGGPPTGPSQGPRPPGDEPRVPGSAAEPRGDDGEGLGADTEADTQAWRAFLESSDEPERRKAVGAPFRIITLLAGLAAFVVIVLLLLR